MSYSLPRTTHPHRRPTTSSWRPSTVNYRFKASTCKIPATVHPEARPQEKIYQRRSGGRRHLGGRLGTSQSCRRRRQERAGTVFHGRKFPLRHLHHRDTSRGYESRVTARCSLPRIFLETFAKDPGAGFDCSIRGSREQLAKQEIEGETWALGHGRLARD